MKPRDEGENYLREKGSWKFKSLDLLPPTPMVHARPLFQQSSSLDYGRS